jgi:hypothetical protein
MHVSQYIYLELTHLPKTKYIALVTLQGQRVVCFS